VALAVQRQPQLERLAQQLPGLLVERLAPADGAQRQEQARLHLGLAGQLGLDAARAVGDEVPGGHLLRPASQGIALLEHLHQKPQDLLGAACLRRLGARLPHGGGQPGQQRQDHQGGGPQAEAVTARELEGAIPRPLRPRGHGMAREIALEVVRQRSGRGVPLPRVRAQRHEHDGVEVARQPPPLGGGRRRRRGRRLRLPAGGPLAAQQLVEDHAQRVDVGRGGHRLAAELLGGRVLGREQARPRPRGQGGLGRVLGAQQLGDAEVQELEVPGGDDQDVRGLQVAVDHQVVMGVLHRLADAAQQREAGLQRQPARLAVGDDGLALHVLHGEIGATVLAHAPVEEACDRRVLQARQDLPLAPEALQHLRRVQAPLDELDGGALVEPAVPPLGQVHHTHAAPAQLAHHPPGPDPLRRLLRGIGLGQGLRQRGDDGPRRLGQEALRAPVRGQQHQHLRPQLGIIAAAGGDEPGPLLFGALQQPVHQVRDAGPGRRGQWRRHPEPSGCSSFRR
jgi:hypothetical protein